MKANLSQCFVDTHKFDFLLNMSYLYIPEIDKKIELFGRSRGEEMAHAVAAPLLGQRPIDPELAKLCDEGDIKRYSAEVVDQLCQSLGQAAETLIGSDRHD